MNELQKFRTLNQLKSVYRANSLAGRRESTAEHTWSALMLADYFFSNIDQHLDKLKVYELLMYHDVVEIEAGDTPLDPANEATGQQEKERLAAIKLKAQLPARLQDKFLTLFHEFEAGQSPEARYAKAIDTLDAMVQGLDHKADWAGWTREFVVSKKENLFTDFPQLLREFHKILDYLEQEGYFNQRG